MGIDLLDIKFRLERDLRVRIRQDDFLTALTRDIRAGGPEAEDGPVLFRAGTVGALYALALEQLCHYPRHGCLCAPVFYRLRRDLGELFGTGRERVTPSSRLDDLIPRRQRRRNWQQLARALDLPLPALSRPAWLERAIRNSCLVSVLPVVFFPALLAAAVAVAPLLGRPAAEPVWILLSLIAGTGLKSGLAHLLTVPCAVHFPESCATVRGLIKTLMHTDYGRIVEQEQAWHERDVWNTLQGILAEALGVSPEEVTPEAHLVRDLGAA